MAKHNPATRPEMIAHLAKVSAQWGITKPNGQVFTAADFERASDDWLKKQTKSLMRDGRKLAEAQH